MKGDFKVDLKQRNIGKHHCWPMLQQSASAFIEDTELEDTHRNQV